ncbi:MAG: hypothetical protein OQK75_06895 [Gammaproteobacteria bacterium]|nr:hypothetical protein [Gammaproteobacteria bacterium]MCW8987384.1 hypothetical protein [Gammaproteobacteria bacterium]MCW9032170.1 hypothetical protein [Gammaproteobacteria bacterium]
MKMFKKLMCMVLSLALSTYTLPVLAATSSPSSHGEESYKIELKDAEMMLIVGGSGSVDAVMSEYIMHDPNTAPIAEATVTNRSNITVSYTLDVMDISGTSLEILTSGSLAPGESKVISGTATVADKSSVRVKVGGTAGLVAIDTAYLLTKY